MKKRIILLALFILTAGLFARPLDASAAKLDEILKYEITINVNDDATLKMDYYIQWKVLSDKNGTEPLDWVEIGIPNAHVSEPEYDSQVVKKARVTYSYGTNIRLDFARSHYKDEVIDIHFSINQDYMYEMNALTEGETVYYFVPGWFDEIDVDEIKVSWNSSKAIGHSSGCTEENGYFVWTGQLSAGQKFKEISVTYNNDAFAFDESRSEEQNTDKNNGYGYGYDYDDDSDDGASVLLSCVIWMAIIVSIVTYAVRKSASYSSGTGFTTKTEMKKQVKRTLIKYYPNCPGCGAPRPEDKDRCEYCGRSFIESEEVIEEKEIAEPKKYENEGTFRYGSAPNTYIRVHVTHVPVTVRVPAPASTRSHSSCAHSSCAHSSCACAHSCACACACACAGGGRAGCSTKDFYNTGLKLRQLELKKSKRKTRSI